MRVLIVATLDTLALCRLPRLFHEAGYEVDLMGPAGLTAMRSRFIRARLLPDAMGARSEYTRIVLADEGAALPLVKRPDRFLLEALDAGIRMPACEICDYPETALAAAQVMGFPVLMQPGGAAANENELAALDFEGPVVVQSARGERGSIAAFFDKGAPRCWFAYFTHGDEIEIFSHKDLADLIEKTGNLTGFAGLANIEFVFDRERDEVLFSRFHPWPDRCLYLDGEAGIDFASALRRWGSENAVEQFPLGTEGCVVSTHSLRHLPWSDPGLLMGELMNYRRLRASSSSSVRGQSDPSKRESPRSASTLPPV